MILSRLDDLADLAIQYIFLITLKLTRASKESQCYSPSVLIGDKDLFRDQALQLNPAASTRFTTVCQLATCDDCRLDLPPYTIINIQPKDGSRSSRFVRLLFNSHTKIPSPVLKPLSEQLTLQSEASCSTNRERGSPHVPS
ncbi:hypothetical protein TNCV_1921601 [Trichonephila clavipes]|nr:hypothetical protein TNCV_1921601 [Trichonephila clavipes]